MAETQNTALWKENFSTFWYNDREIFSMSQDELDAKARKMAENGVTTITTFSVTHFRLGFYPYWKEINECIRKIVIAFHKVGIKVVEHHSSHLTHNLKISDGWNRFDADINAYGGGESSYDSWKKIYPFLICDQTIDGKKLESFCQIDGRTGKIADTVYSTYAMCFNNPDYRKVYFDYVKSVVALGVDGIMNDDVQYFGDCNACACEHCRRLFKEQTGYDLPSPENWDEFFNDYSNPIFIAWKRFKFQSTERFYRDLTKLYDEYAPGILRPNYSSDVLKHCPTCYSFDKCPDLWWWVSQENCFSAIIKESYMDFYTEAVHRYAMGARQGAPSVSEFYPDREDTIYFAWALARIWGQMYSGLCEGKDISEMEKKYREFENKNFKFMHCTQKRADISFYFSQNTRDFTENAHDLYQIPFMAQMQACWVSGLCVDMVFATDSVEELLKHKRIAMSHVAMLSQDELHKLNEYVTNGGCLVVSGEFAKFDENGSVRNKSELEADIGFKMPEKGSCAKIGQGSVYVLENVDSLSEFQPTIWSFRRTETPPPGDGVGSKWTKQANGSGALYKEIISDPMVTITGAERLTAWSYNSPGGITVYVVNLSNTIREDAGHVYHSDVVENFCANAKKLNEISLSVRLDSNQSFNKARLYTPENTDAIDLDIRIESGTAFIKIPQNSFAGFAMIGIE